MTSSFRNRLIVDLNLLAKNIEELRKQVRDKEIIFMVKADAYGHGILPVAKFCIQKLGIKELGVASLDEALFLREKLNQDKFEIYVFSDIRVQDLKCLEYYKFKRIIPVVSHLDDLRFILDQKDLKHFPLCFKFNTGMNRLGLLEKDLEEIKRLLREKNRKNIYHLMTHFACGAMPMEVNKQNKRQRESFDRIKEFFVDNNFILERSSSENSGVTEQLTDLDESHIRPGLMLYGPTSLLPQYKDRSSWNGQSISQLETYIIDAFKVSRGQPIGYGGSVLADEGVVVVLAIGYGDGFFNTYRGATLKYNNMSGKVFGRVNMDMTQVFFKGEDIKKFKKGDKFIIWEKGNCSSLEKFCQETKTIPYEILCALSRRVPRKYLS